MDGRNKYEYLLLYTHFDLFALFLQLIYVDCGWYDLYVPNVGKQAKNYNCKTYYGFSSG